MCVVCMLCMCVCARVLWVHVWCVHVLCVACVRCVLCVHVCYTCMCAHVYVLRVQAHVLYVLCCVYVCCVCMCAVHVLCCVCCVMSVLCVCCVFRAYSMYVWFACVRECMCMCCILHACACVVCVLCVCGIGIVMGRQVAQESGWWGRAHCESWVGAHWTWGDVMEQQKASHHPSSHPQCQVVINVPKGAGSWASKRGAARSDTGPGTLTATLPKMHRWQWKDAPHHSPSGSAN